MMIKSFKNLENTCEIEMNQFSNITPKVMNIKIDQPKYQAGFEIGSPST